MTFDRLTAVRRLTDPADSQNACYEAPIDLQFLNHGGATFGGTFSALVVRALMDFHGPGWRPASITINFLIGPKPGTVSRITVELDKAGRTFAFTTFRILSAQGKKQLTGTAVFTTIPPHEPQVAREDLIAAPATNVPEKTYQQPVGPGKYLDIFDVRDSGPEGERLSREIMVGGRQREVLLRGSEKFVRLASGEHVSWPLLAMYADLPLYPPSSFADRVKRREEGFRPAYSTVAHTITFNYLPESIWMRQVRADVTNCGEVKEFEFYFYPLEGGIPAMIGRQIGWWREVPLAKV